MKRPKQAPQLSILGFFGRKPKSKREVTAGEERTVVRSQEEIHLTLTPSEGTAPSYHVLSSASVVDSLECPLCLLLQPLSCFPPLSSCPHLSCLDCLQQYLRIEITESRVEIACPQCPEPLHPWDVHRLLTDTALLERYEEYLLRRLLASDPDSRWCPAPDCSYAVIAYGCAECPRLACGRNGCKTEFCYHCRQLWHPNETCEQAWRQLSQGAPGVLEPSALLIYGEESGKDIEEVKICPRCGAFIMKIKDGSCNRMNCTVCGCLFCWLCLREITDVHFLSPSGCTFWGKKPWSRTRKILWQLGMLLGAPMVISLVAGIAVPVIVIGIPVYMGKKVFSRSRKGNLSGCKQCLSVASGVLLSAFISPVIAAVTVGVGVPLMLTYVYGVVTLSICRSRWRCRGNRGTSSDLGMMELDNLTKLNELWAVLPNSVVGETSSMEAASLHSARRSHHDRRSRKEQDSQSASTVALAGSMLSETQDPSYRLAHLKYVTRSRNDWRWHLRTSSQQPDKKEAVDVPDWLEAKLRMVNKVKAEKAIFPRKPSKVDGVNFEVEVEIETQPRTAREQSLGSVISVQSFSGESLACSREQLCLSSDATSKGTAAETHSMV